MTRAGSDSACPYASTAAPAASFCYTSATTTSLEDNGNDESYNDIEHDNEQEHERDNDNDLDDSNSCSNQSHYSYSYCSYNSNSYSQNSLQAPHYNYESIKHINKPIVVGYAFGPKKMSTMGVVLAEASRVKVIHEELEEDRFNDDNNEGGEEQHHEDCHEDAALFCEQHPHQQDHHPTSPSLLTSAALKGHEEETTERIGSSSNVGGGNNNDNGITARSTIITLGNSNNTDLQQIVRYFRSSCSSAAASASIASMGETTASTSTPTTMATTNTNTSCCSTFSTPNSTANTNITTYKHHHHQQQHGSSGSGRGEKNRFPVQISFVPLDPNQPLEEQHGGKFDLILHKLTEDILTCSLMQDDDDDDDANSNDANSVLKFRQDPSWKRVRAIRDYCYVRNPNCCLVDDPKHVQLVMSRSRIARVLQQCLNGVETSSGIPVKSPRFVVVPEYEYENKHCAPRPDSNDENENQNSQQHRRQDQRMRKLKQALRDNHQGDGTILSTPLIVKPIIAAGTKQSHSMLIALKESALNKLPPRSIVQEFVNHDATLYKVYVLGDFVNVYRRHSLPDLPSDLSDATVDMVEFDSQRPYPKLKDFGFDTTENINDNNSGSSSIDVNNNVNNNITKSGCAHANVNANTNSTFMVTVEEVRPIVDVLKRAFGLELFGFDILMGSNSGECFVVDVNYFPSYKEVPNFPSLLAQYLTQRALEQRRKGRIQTTTNASNASRGSNSSNNNESNNERNSNNIKHCASQSNVTSSTATTCDNRKTPCLSSWQHLDKQ
uniref:Uncharacterized protein n=1 Tax=Pseudo-nitzschia australis TaxID=44445 RepID=A0A7S4EKH0_9STRA